MTQKNISIYKINGTLLGYFDQAKVSRFGEDEYAIQGPFYGPDGSVLAKLEFNPQSLPHWGQVESSSDIKHKQLTNIYIQRGRQPILVTALGVI